MCCALVLGQPDDCLIGWGRNLCKHSIVYNEGFEGNTFCRCHCAHDVSEMKSATKEEDK